MVNFRNLARFGLAALVAIIVIGSAFFVGYVTGQGDGDSGQQIGDQSSILSQIPKDTATPLPAATATDIPVLSPTPATEAVTGSSETETFKGFSEATVAPSPTAPAENNGSNSSTAMSEEEALNLLREVWGLVDEEFYGDLPSTDERTYGAIRGMLNTLDDEYTSFTEPQIAEIRRTGSIR